MAGILGINITKFSWKFTLNNKTIYQLLIAWNSFSAGCSLILAGNLTWKVFQQTVLAVHCTLPSGFAVEVFHVLQTFIQFIKTPQQLSSKMPLSNDLQREQINLKFLLVYCQPWKRTFTHLFCGNRLTYHSSSNWYGICVPRDLWKCFSSDWILPFSGKELLRCVNSI
jgi:hypothetical protein